MGASILTLHEACAELRVSEKTLRAILARGELLGRKVGAQWRIRADDITSYLKGDPCPSTPEATPGTMISSSKDKGIAALRTSGPRRKSPRQKSSSTSLGCENRPPWADLLGR